MTKIPKVLWLLTCLISYIVECKISHWLEDLLARSVTSASFWLSYTDTVGREQNVGYFGSHSRKIPSPQYYKHLLPNICWICGGRKLKFLGMPHEKCGISWSILRKERLFFMKGRYLCGKDKFWDPGNFDRWEKKSWKQHFNIWSKCSMYQGHDLIITSIANKGVNVSAAPFILWW